MDSSSDMGGYGHVGGPCALPPRSACPPTSVSKMRPYSPAGLPLVPLPQGNFVLAMFTQRISFSGFSSRLSQSISATTEHTLTQLQDLKCHLLQWEPTTTCPPWIPAGPSALLVQSLSSASRTLLVSPSAPRSIRELGFWWIYLREAASASQPQSCHPSPSSPWAFSIAHVYTHTQFKSIAILWLS